MRDFIIFGKGDFANILRYIIEEEMHRNVVAYMVNREFLDADHYDGKPVIPYEEIDSFYKPSDYAVSLGYEAHDMYRTRERLQNCVLAPFSKVGNGNVFWATAQIQHHNVVGNYNCIAPGAASSGYVRISNHCFLGTNSTIKNSILIANYTLIGAGAYVSKDIEEYDVIVPTKSRRLEGKNSLDFGS